MLFCPPANDPSPLAVLFAPYAKLLVPTTDPLLRVPTVNASLNVFLPAAVSSPVLWRALMSRA